MKLKKIASLMLAGVMAASMLAGCQTTSNDQPTQPEQPTNPSTGYSAMVNGYLSPVAKSNITMADDSDLDKALDSAMNFVAGSGIAFAYDWYQIPTLCFIGAGDVANDAVGDDEALRMALADMVDSMDAENDKTNGDHNLSNIFDVLNPYCTTKQDDREDDDRNVTLMYVIDGRVGYDAVMKQVASNLDDEIKALESYYTDKTDDKYDVRYNYVGSVSADTITLDADHGKSVTVVAVNIARNLGK